MNFYQHHLGDYLKDTAHLTMIEDGAYRRLIDLYYLHEQPLPSDKKQLYRLARATTPAERKTIDSVLEEYFYQTDDGYRHSRCDSELEAAGEKTDESTERKNNEKERKRRYRERVKVIFSELREFDIVPKFDTPMPELERLLAQAKERDRNADRDGTKSGQGTGQAPDRDATGTAIQYPVTNNQYPITNKECVGNSTVVGDGDSATHTPSKATQIAILMRKHDIKGAQSANPEIIALAAQNVPLESVEAAILDVKERKPGESVNVRYIVMKLEDWAKKAANINVAGAKPPESRDMPAHDDWWKSDAGTDRKARELGMQAWGNESYNDFRQRIFDEIRKRKSSGE